MDLKVSIITVTYNSAATLEQTMLSVLEQTYTNIEYIIVDGGSTDGTLKIIEKYKSKISKCISIGNFRLNPNFMIVFINKPYFCRYLHFRADFYDFKITFIISLNP